ncbi:MAG TPA: Cof-type HAD-IIB family hydrolase [Candidatus Kryptobacter bacterium]|nr:MAG: hypothetical protein B7Z63_03940 [Ignavibacteriae bacterium 37-53-5]HQT90697.1 Cof-type HAD-IIB family hydrolase [Candidatus Kryptobacter bacterium]
MDNLSPKFIRKLKQIKLIATDLDGTLLNNQGQISDVTRESVWKLKGLGMRVAIMTARAHSSAERIADELDMKSPIISLDGGLVRLPHSGQNIFASYIKPKVVRTVISEAEKRFSSVALFVDNKMMRLESDTMLPSYIDSLELDTIVVEDLAPYADRTIQVIVGADSKAVIKAIARKAIGLFSRVTVNVYRSSQHGDRWYLEIKNKNYSKATGLAHLEKYFRVGKDEVAVLGDFKNDLEAFKRAGTGVAMKNAVWELKERADLITESSNDDNGAAEFFNLIFKIRSNSRH